MANRILIGKDPNNVYCLKVSKAGQNVLSTDNSVFTFNTRITDSTSGYTSTGGRAFNVIQSGVISPTGSTDTSSVVYFPSIVDNSGNYAAPFIHCLYEKEVAITGVPAGYYWGYSNDTAGYNYGAYLQAYSHGYNSSGGNWTSGTQYGRITWTYKDPLKLSISYYVLAVPCHE